MKAKKLHFFYSSSSVMFLWVWLIFGAYTSWGQEKSFTTPDSLKGHSYVKLYNAYARVKSDTLKSKTYLYTILKNAKNSKDSLRMAVAYCHLSYYMTEESKKLVLLDSSITVSKDINHITYPIKAYSFKGGYYLQKGEYQQALDNYMQALTLSEKKNNINYLHFTKHNIGFIKTKIGGHQEALELIRESYKYTKQKYGSGTQPYLNSLILLAESYTYNQKTDSASLYNQEGIVLSLQNENLRNAYYGKLVLNEGINLFFKKEYQQAYDSIIKGVSLLNKNNPVNRENYILGSFYLAKLKQVQGDTLAAEKEFIRMDSIIQKEKMVVMQTREGYEFLISRFKAKDKKELQLEYVNKLLWFDKKFHKTNSSVSTRLFKEFDTPLLIKEKETLIQELKDKAKNMNFLVGFLIVLSIIITMFLYYQYIVRKKYQQKFNELVDVSKSAPIMPKKPLNVGDIGITNDIVVDILDKLSVFEQNHQFLKKNINIATLAKEMNTNTKYLSKIINHHKNKSFTTYINDQRIRYSVEQLKEDGVLKNYTIQGIAEEMGFNNAESFSSAFKKSTGIKPSYFIRKLYVLNEN